MARRMHKFDKVYFDNGEVAPPGSFVWVDLDDICAYEPTTSSRIGNAFVRLCLSFRDISVHGTPEQITALINGSTHSPAGRTDIEPLDFTDVDPRGPVKLVRACEALIEASTGFAEHARVLSNEETDTVHKTALAIMREAIKIAEDALCG